MVDVTRKGSEVAGLHGGVLSQGAVAGPVGQPEHPLADGEPVVAYPNSTTTPDRSWPGTLGVRSRPERSAHVVGQSSSPRVPGGMGPHDDIVLGGVGVGDVRQGEPTDAGISVSNGYGLHDSIFPKGQRLGAKENMWPIRAMVLMLTLGPDAWRLEPSPRSLLAVSHRDGKES